MRTHMDELPFGWWETKWRERNPWPDTLGDTKNYVLTVAEVTQYALILEEAAKELAREAAIARTTVRALTIPAWSYHRAEYEPRMFTLAHVLQFMHTMAKQKLGVLHFLTAATGVRAALVRVPKGEQA